jgi:dihydroorotase
MEKKRILIFGGRVIDPSNGLDKVADIEIENGKISKIGENLKNLETKDYDLLVDATDCLVTPGKDIL